jgi:hypothetical protein
MPRPGKGQLPDYHPHIGKPLLPDTTPAKGVFDPKTSVRIAKDATARSDTYKNADGSYTRRLYGRPVNYRAADGSWQPIDADLVAGPDGRLHTAANPVALTLPGPRSAAHPLANFGFTTDLVSLALPAGAVVAHGYDPATPVDPVVDRAVATYRGVLPSTDLDVLGYHAGAVETLTLRSAGGPSSWLLPLDLKGVTPRAAADGSIGLYTPAGTRVAWFAPGRMEDSGFNPGSGTGARSAGVTLTLTTAHGVPALRVVADAAWLRDPARVYPVKVRPVTLAAVTGDAQVDGGAVAPGDDLAVGAGTAAAQVLSLDQLPASYAGYHIGGATLKLYLNWAASCSSPRPLSVGIVPRPTGTAPRAATVPGDRAVRPH